MDLRPGDIILDRYLPDADPEVREEARAALRVLAVWIVKSAKAAQAEARSSPEALGRRTMEERSV